MVSILLPLASNHGDCIRSAEPLGIGQIAGDEHSGAPQASVTVDGHLALPQGKVHDLDHVQDAGEGGNSVILPAVVVKEHCTSQGGG